MREVLTSGNSLTHTIIIENKPSLKTHATNTVAHTRRQGKIDSSWHFALFKAMSSMPKDFDILLYPWSLLSSIFLSTSELHTLKNPSELPLLRRWWSYSLDAYTPLFSAI